MIDGKVEIAHEHETAEGHGEVAHSNMGLGAVAGWCLCSHSDPQDIEDHSEDSTGHDDGDDPRDHSRCRRIPDGGGAVTALETPQATRKSNEYAVDRRPEDAPVNICQ